jgi:hypothetical protein
MRAKRESLATFGQMADQRQEADKEVDPETLAQNAPGLYGARPPRLRRVLAFSIAFVFLLALAGSGVALSRHRKPPEAKTTVPPTTVPPTTATAVIGGRCQFGVVSSTIAYTSSQNAQGDYVVTATGIALNQSSGPLRDVRLDWVITYAGLSDSQPISTVVSGGRTIARGASASWSSTASTKDGRVPPSGVKITFIKGNYFYPICHAGHGIP